MEVIPQPPSAPPAERVPDRVHRPRRSTTIGVLLVLLGAVLLLAQFANIDLGHYGWPFLIIVPGLVLLFFAMTSPGFVSEGFAILGSITTITGLILLYQNSTDHFESWAYAWALVFPGAVGIGMILYGVINGRPGNVRYGTRLLAVGLVIFFLGVVFFEGVIGIGGYDLGRSAGVIAGIVVIALGALLLALNISSWRRRAP